MSVKLASLATLEDTEGEMGDLLVCEPSIQPVNVIVAK